MAKTQTIFSCSKCGAQYPKWQGRCLDCGAWGTLTEELKKSENSANTARAEKTINLSTIIGGKETRTPTGLNEVDRVLGGGIINGALMLLGGDPGIGKSTLALQLIDRLDSVLYVSGEESATQIKMRAERLTNDLSKLKFLPQTDIDTVIATATALKPQLLIVDSIQTVYTADSPGAAGNVGQITACTAKLMSLAKTNNIAVLVIGHVTKDGQVAGPKTLEHLVDTVMYLENDAQNNFKILRTVKNRFGAVGEIGVFEMTGSGLKEVSDPAGVFADKELSSGNPGISATMVLEGTRPFLVEVQSLTAKTFFGYPQRKTTGFDLNRLQMLLAVIGKYNKVNLSNQDVYLNVAGGLKIKEPPADLAVAMAVISAFTEKSLPNKTLILGEVGLSGEIRSVPQLARRLKEAQRLGYVQAIVPARPDAPSGNLKLLPIKHISEVTRIIGTLL
ncbi:MAG: DNA repair protein RadA [Patescibacteria group bacterium]|jgi:DNA repair protein RadA/Sms